MPFIKCFQCPKIIYKTPFAIKAGKKGIFCSRKCFGLAIRTKKSVRCKGCKKLIFRHLCFIKNNKTNSYFCNFKCRLDRVIKKCCICKKKVERQRWQFKKYGRAVCSNKCKKIALGYEIPQIKQCSQCKSSFKRAAGALKQNKNNRWFCSRKCHQLFMIGKKHPTAWINQPNNIEKISCQFCKQITERYKERKYDAHPKYKFCSWSCYLQALKTPGYSFKRRHGPLIGEKKYLIRLLQDFATMVRTKKEVNYEYFGKTDKPQNSPLRGSYAA